MEKTAFVCGFEKAALTRDFVFGKYLKALNNAHPSDLATKAMKDLANKLPSARASLETAGDAAKKGRIAKIQNHLDFMGGKYVREVAPKDRLEKVDRDLLRHLGDEKRRLQGRKP